MFVNPDLNQGHLIILLKNENRNNLKTKELRSMRYKRNNDVSDCGMKG